MRYYQALKDTIQFGREEELIKIQNVIRHTFTNLSRQLHSWKTAANQITGEGTDSHSWIAGSPSTSSRSDSPDRSMEILEFAPKTASGTIDSLMSNNSPPSNTSINEDKICNGRRRGTLTLRVPAIIVEGPAG